MLRLIGRKTLLIVVLIPILHAVGFFYAVTHPHDRDLYRDTSVGSLYRDYVSRLLAGDWGTINTASMGDVIWPAVTNSLILLAIVIAIAIIAGPLLGLAGVSRRNQRMTTTTLLMTTAGASMPGFFLGVMIVSLMIYGVVRSTASGTLLPLSGFGLDRHLILPVVVLATGPTLQIARVTANLLENELHQDYIRVARSKGLSWPAIILTHALPNIAAPVLVTIGRSMRLLISGLIVVESLFIWPGLGRLFTFSVGLRTDGRSPLAYFLHPELLATLAVIFGLALLITDLITSVLVQRIDPRLALSATGKGQGA